MKILRLLRHAKSSWQEVGADDHDRRLNERGLKACAKMAEHVGQADNRYVISSSALRAQQTAKGVLLPEWSTSSALYTFDWHALREFTAGLDDRFDDALLIGHNPAITEFINHCSNGRIDNVPTCGYAQLEFDVGSWADLASERGRFVDFLAPKLI